VGDSDSFPAQGADVGDFVAVDDVTSVYAAYAAERLVAANSANP
jgi:hypothetical protein